MKALLARLQLCEWGLCLKWPLNVVYGSVMHSLERKENVEIDKYIFALFLWIDDIIIIIILRKVLQQKNYVLFIN